MSQPVLPAPLQVTGVRQSISMTLPPISTGSGTEESEAPRSQMRLTRMFRER